MKKAKIENLEIGEYYLVKASNWSPSGFAVSIWDGKDFICEATDERIVNPEAIYELPPSIEELEMETMDIYTAPGEKVVFLGKNGYDHQPEEAKKYLEVGKEYTVEGIDVGSSSSRVYLTEFPEKGFNTVMFRNI